MFEVLSRITDQFVPILMRCAFLLAQAQSLLQLAASQEVRQHPNVPVESPTESQVSIHSC